MSESRQQRRWNERKGIDRMVLTDARGDDVTPYWKGGKFIVPIPACDERWEAKIDVDILSAVNMRGADTVMTNTVAERPAPRSAKSSTGM